MQNLLSFKFLTVIGARPQIIKAAALSRAIRQNNESKLDTTVNEIILHTGQHYDQNMSEVFFKEMGIPAANINLAVGSGMHGEQTAKMISGIEKVILRENPDMVVLYGDTNSTLAGAITASKLHVPVAHIEAGLRSFNKSMPEEINRIVCDHSSTLLFSPTLAGVENLKKEGFKNIGGATFNREDFNFREISIDNPAVIHTGDIMFDNSLYFSDLAAERIDALKVRYGEKFVLATVHRDSNTDNPNRLNSIFEALVNISLNNLINIVVPLHPRTLKLLKANLNADTYSKLKFEESNLSPKDSEKLADKHSVVIIPPASFLEMTALENASDMIITDSGGVQKEAFFFGKPSLILRSETEWVEIVECGAALLVDARREKILEGYSHFKALRPSFPHIFGNGAAANQILAHIIEYLSAKNIK